MKLTYRGQAYELPTLSQFGAHSTDQSKLKLIYRGHSYTTTPRSAAVSQAVKCAESIVAMTYRGITYERILQSPKSYQQPRIINWRYQQPAEG